MTLYAGKTVQVTTTATGLDGTTPITDDDVSSVVIEIRDKELEEVLAETAMTWDETEGFWFYDWDTEGVEPATYKAKCTITAGAWETFEYKRIRLARGAF